MLWYLNLYENDGTRSAMWGRAFLQIMIIQKKKKIKQQNRKEKYSWCLSTFIEARKILERQC